MFDTSNRDMHRCDHICESALLSFVIEAGMGLPDAEYRLSVGHAVAKT